MSKETGTKRMSQNESTDRINKRAKGTGSTSMRLLLVGKYCGYVVGKGGENLARLRMEHNVDLDMPSGRTDPRVLSVGGEQDECIALAKDLLDTCREAPYPVGQRCSFEMNLLISTDIVGLIIGKGGQRLKEIREESNGKIKVYQKCLPHSNERVVALGGDCEEDVVTALKMILDVVNDAPRTRVLPYDPSNKPSEVLGAGMTGYGMVPVMEQGYSALGHGHSGGVHTIEEIMRMLQGDEYSGGMGGSMEGEKEGNLFDQVSTVTTLAVTNEMCGIIIGKGGVQIKNIRSTSGAKVEFSESNKLSNADRVITISGTQKQVNFAVLQMAVRMQSPKFHELKELAKRIRDNSSSMLL